MSNPHPHLILHKVRGEPAFDIAIEIDRDVWIIPTSGHRAYPFRKWDLYDLVDTSDIKADGRHESPPFRDAGIPLDWPDHYTAVNRTKAASAVVTQAARQLAELNITDDELEIALAAIRKGDRK